MPKLNSDIAQKVDSAEDGFTPVEEGVYTLQLAKDVDIKEGPKGPYWKWEFVIPEGLQHSGRKFFTNTSLSESAFFKLKEAFGAFGVATDTDTEDLVGQKVKALITIRTAQGGARAGEPTNEISKLLPLDTDDASVEVPKANGSNGESKKADEPLF